MTARESNDNGREKDTDIGSPERRLGEVVKQTEIVRDQLEGERHRAERVEELEAGIQKLIGENVRGNYRDLLLDGWGSLADALEEGENPEAGLWSWHFKTQEVLHLVTGDLDHAGFVDRESPPYSLAIDSFDLARCAWAAAGTPDDRTRWLDMPNADRDVLEHATGTYRRVGESLGKIRVDVLGELEFEGTGGQQYDAVELSPEYGSFQGDNCSLRSEAHELETGDFHGQILKNGIQLHYRAESDGGDWELSFMASPDDCREMAMSLLEVAADAEHSEEVDA